MQNNNALQLVNSVAAADAALNASKLAARKSPPARIPSPAAQLARQRFTLVSQTWASPTLPDATRQAYNALAPKYPVGPTGATSGRALFVSLNIARLQANMDILTDLPPQMRELTPPIETFTLAVVNTGPDFHVVLTGPTDFDGLFLVACTRPLTPGTTRLRPDDYLSVTSATHLSAAVLDVGTAYLNAIGYAASAGMRVGVCLTPLSPLGFPGEPVYRDALVESA